MGGPVTVAAPRPSFAQIARNRPYILYLGAANVATLGYGVYAVAIVWFSYRLAGGLVVSGEVLGIEYGAYTLTFLFGPLVDRARDKRLLFVTTFPAQAAIVAAVAYLGSTGSLSTWELLTGVAAVSLLWDVAWAGFNVVPRLLLSPNELFAGGGVSGVAGSGAALAGYALGGAAIVGLGPAGGLWVYAAALGLAALLAAVNPIRAQGRATAEFWRSMREGWELIFVTERRTLGGLALADVARGFAVAGPTLLIVVVTHELFQTSATAFAAFFVASVVGTTSADLLLGRLNPRGRIGGLLIGAMAGAALGTSLLGWLPPAFPVLLSAWFAIGFALEVYFNSRVTYVHGRFAPELQGRIAGNLYLFTGLPSAVGAVALASLAAGAPLLETAVVVGAGFGLCAVLLAIQSPLRSLSF